MKRLAIEKGGVTVVICCHNSAERITETLECLQQQEHCQDISWEVLLVDNKCSDHTIEAAKLQWERRPVVDFKIVTEPELGLTNARMKGISEAKFEIISFIDDDNRVDEDWVSQLPALFEQNPDMAAIGGFITASFESDKPSWFDEFEAYYAVGAQAKAEGELDSYKGYLCGAGLSVRKSVLKCLFAQGFKFDLVGRQGKRLLCSEDLELCLALKMAGWKLHYCPSLRMRHFMPNARMSWPYLKRLARGVGFSLSGLKPYYVVVGNSHRSARMEWFRSSVRALQLMLYFTAIKLRYLGSSGVGQEVDLQFERALGLLQGMFLRRKLFIDAVDRLRNNTFLQCSPDSQTQ